MRVSKKRHLMDDHNFELEGTSRPPKRQRDSDDMPQLPPTGLSRFYTSPSPSKQLQALEDEEQPVYFCNFGDTEEHEERAVVLLMRDAIQNLADGVGILGYTGLRSVTGSLSSALDRRRLEYLWANDCSWRLAYGKMPPITTLQSIVRAGWSNDRGTGTSEDDWNTDVQHPLLKLACETCQHKASINIYGVHEFLSLWLETT
ncbi:hypothetical protein EJ04DRAFT_505360 [Polyplosphaeria fusca]|uniref:Uncharacterized protein n=1 Tax=Polyplosphaeria fusca TaxID=682080 RepID=A0A9P4UUX9_9PLEO|nr:hypothetical protein EJ04DRAFT_505360 [Polyplosphaeria fusca]